MWKEGETDRSLSTFGHLRLAVRGKRAVWGRFKRGRGGGFSVASHFLEQVEVVGMPFCSQTVIMVIEAKSVWMPWQEVSHKTLKLRIITSLRVGSYLMFI